MNYRDMQDTAIKLSTCKRLPVGNDLFLLNKCKVLRRLCVSGNLTSRTFFGWNCFRSFLVETLAMIPQINTIRCKTLSYNTIHYKKNNTPSVSSNRNFITEVSISLPLSFQILFLPPSLSEPQRLQLPTQ